MCRIKAMNKGLAKRYNLKQYPRIFYRGDPVEAKEYFGEDSKLVRSGTYIYSVPKRVYNEANFGTSKGGTR